MIKSAFITLFILKCFELITLHWGWIVLIGATAWIWGLIKVIIKLAIKEK